MTRRPVDPELHDPGNHLPRVETIFAFLSVQDDGKEGLLAARMGDTFFPLVAADEARLASYRPIAREIAERSGKKVVLAKFTTRIDEWEFEP